MEKVFVYGTLMEGFWNNRFLNGCTKVCAALTTEKFAMDDIGFPRARRAWKGMNGDYVPNEVLGEVWLVPMENVVGNLDYLERNGVMYEREKVAVYCENGETCEAWMYLYLRPLDNLPVPNGDWRAFSETYREDPDELYEEEDEYEYDED